MLRATPVPGGKKAIDARRGFPPAHVSIAEPWYLHPDEGCRMGISLPVIINPAAGRGSAVLKELNRVFFPAGISWSVEVTLGEGDAYRKAQAIAAGGAEVVAVVGGDGTVSEVATALAGTQTALAILPGGTGNVLARELKIPRTLSRAAKLLTGELHVRVIDLGQVGERKYLLRAGVGFEALVIQHTPRQLKERFGLLAYGIAGLKSLRETRPLHFEMELDGETAASDGFVCTVANSAQLGLPGLSLSPVVRIDDGLLDVIVLRTIDLERLISSSGEAGGVARLVKGFPHWRVKQAKIVVDPPQNVQLDGDLLGRSPFEVTCAAGCLRVVVPAPSV